MREKSFGTFYFPLVMILIGIGWLLDSLDVFNFWSVFGDWWPALIILAGLASLRSHKESITGPLLVIVVGVFLLLATIDSININFFAYFWPTLIIIIGISLLMHRKKSASVADSENTIKGFTMFGGIEKNNASQAFQGGDITTLFGGAKIDLRMAQMANNAELSVFAAFGGIEILVPDSCEVSLKVTPFFGGSEDKRTLSEKPTQKLIIRGSVWFGGVEVKR